jgi:uncharacterized membrane protein
MLMLSPRSSSHRILRYWASVLLLGVAVPGSGCDGGKADLPDGASPVGDARDGKTDAGVTCPAPAQVPTFSQDVRPFLEARCNVCHSSHPRDGGFAPGSQNFETYAGFKVWAEDSLTSMRQGTMPPSESDSPASAAEYCMLKAWIDQGAKDD